MSKIVKKIITGGLEFARDSAKQLAQTVSPDALLKQALGQPQKNEFTDYLKSVGQDLTPEEMAKKKEEFQTDEEKKLAEARKTIRAAIPHHMRPVQKQQEPGIYELSIQEEERKKAQRIEAMKKAPQPLSQPTSKQSRGMLFAKKKTQKGFEGLQKDTKVG